MEEEMASAEREIQERRMKKTEVHTSTRKKTQIFTPGKVDPATPRQKPKRFGL